MVAAASQFDVVLLSDFRFPGGTSQSNAEEIRVQARMGLSTGLVQVASPLIRQDRPINPAIQRCAEEGLASFVAPDARPRCRLLVIRHPTVLLHSRGEMPRLDAERVVVIANHLPRDERRGRLTYELARVQENARRFFGRPALWFPIGPLVRRALESEPGGQDLADDDWTNIIDAAAWRVARTSFVGDRPVIGRHSRDSADKWPDRADELLRAYPDDEAIRVRILGGAEKAGSVLGAVPARWEVLPFDAVAPRDFLAGIDFFVYYHHSSWVEAFGRNILEAMAAGAPAILPPHFAALFGDAALYAEPAEVRSAVTELYADRARYDELSRRAVELVERRFSHDAHARRLERLLAEPPRAATATGWWGRLAGAGARALRVPRGDRRRMTTGLLAANSAYRLRIAIDGVSPGSRGLVRGVARDIGETRFEIPVDGARRAVGVDVLTEDRPQRLDIVLIPDAKDAGRAALKRITASRRGDRPVQPALGLGDTSVSAAMATYPGRRAVLPDVVDRLVGQVDRLFIYLNNYDEVPGFLRRHPRRERIVFILDPASQRRAAAKFHWLPWVRGFHLVCDDDIVYPADYAARMVAEVERHERRAIVGVHGVLFEPHVVDARASRRAVFKFPEPLDRATPVHFLGTGTVAFHAGLLAALDTAPLHDHPIANDEILAVSAKRAGVPMVCIARPAGWLAPHPGARFGIFQERGIRTDEHDRATQLLAGANPWPEPGLPGGDPEGGPAGSPNVADERKST